MSVNSNSAAFAKLAGILKGVISILEGTTRRNELPIQSFSEDEARHYFVGAQTQLVLLRVEIPDLFMDFPEFSIEPSEPMSQGPSRYSRSQLLRLKRDIEQVFEIRANSQLELPSKAKSPDCVFISHGHAEDWRELQAYIEKDIGLNTLELAQKPNLGRTIIGKLVEESDKCNSAVIVMTADDLDLNGQPRARENVIHEIGYFQAKFGLGNVCLVYEDGTNIPSNIQGLVYIPFTKGVINASFGLLSRELRTIYKIR